MCFFFVKKIEKQYIVTSYQYGFFSKNPFSYQLRERLNENEVLPFQNEVLSFQNEVLPFQNEVLSFQNEVLSFQNEVLSFHPTLTARYS